MQGSDLAVGGKLEGAMGQSTAQKVLGNKRKRGDSTSGLVESSDSVSFNEIFFASVQQSICISLNLRIQINSSMRPAFHAQDLVNAKIVSWNGGTPLDEGGPYQVPHC